MSKNIGYMTYECFNCGKGFENPENNMCPHCHSTNFINKEEDCKECRGKGFWWTQTCELEVGAKFSEPKKVICPKCEGTGRIED